MIINKLAIAGAAGALMTLLGASVALGADFAACQTWNSSKITAAMTHCVAWTKEAAALMRAAPCDAKTMTPAEMRARCAEMMAEAERNAHSPGS